MPTSPSPFEEENFIREIGYICLEAGGKFKLEAKQTARLSSLLNRVYKGGLPPKQIARALESECGLNDKTALQALTFLKENLFDFDKDYLNGLYKDQGGCFQDTAIDERRPRDTTPKLEGNIVNLKGP